MKKLSFIISLLLVSSAMFAQVAVNTDGTQPNSSAGLDVKFTNKGFLAPRMTLDQRNAIATPADGLMVFCTDCGSNGALSIYSNGAWMTFAPCIIPASAAGTNIVSPGQIIWNWTIVAAADGYKWNTTSSYGTALDMGTAISKTETGIGCNTTNTRYVWAYNSCGVSLPVTLFQTISAASPVTPTAGTHSSNQTSIIWNWNTVSDVIGYKWNVTNDFGTATEMGLITFKDETGLSCGTAYTRYVWAYNGCGYSTPVTLTQSTLTCWTCGSTITVNHVEGLVAPVTKTVTYGTVTGIPGAPSKCWITSNLGADHQATSVDDATESSAGWYWQFNRKQGYKYEGTTRTPNTTWITIISEFYNWTAANDPCTFEMGAGWRIPTSTEWTNVESNGSWIDWYGPWNSALKMHAAGNLNSETGSLYKRGIGGYYWSSTENDADNGWCLVFNVATSVVISSSKTYGFSLRCLKD
ncbi:MAG: hypothetical protein NTX61_18885 [Bacteroidetes bacterium]|nr:hypothetical protein [Bacteroidota bacterium]